MVDPNDKSRPETQRQERRQAIDFTHMPFVHKQASLEQCHSVFIAKRKWRDCANGTNRKSVLLVLYDLWVWVAEWAAADRTNKG